MPPITEHSHAQQGVEIAISRAVQADAEKASITLGQYMRELADRGMDEAAIGDFIKSQWYAGRGAFAELRASTRATTRLMSSRAATIDAAIEAADGDMDAMGIWQTTGSANVCPGCKKLNGVKMTVGEFIETHGTNECGDACQCFHVPGADTLGDAALVIEDWLAANPERFGLSAPVVAENGLSEDVGAGRGIAAIGAPDEEATDEEVRLLEAQRDGQVLVQFSGEGAYQTADLTKGDYQENLDEWRAYLAQVLENAKQAARRRIDEPVAAMLDDASKAEREAAIRDDEFSKLWASVLAFSGGEFIRLVDEHQQVLNFAKEKGIDVLTIDRKGGIVDVGKAVPVDTYMQALRDNFNE